MMKNFKMMKMMNLTMMTPTLSLKREEQPRLSRMKGLEAVPGPTKRATGQKKR